MDQPFDTHPRRRQRLSRERHGPREGICGLDPPPALGQHTAEWRLLAATTVHLAEEYL